jgi:hypothetical protein
LGLPNDWNVLAHEVENYGETHSLPENAFPLTEGDLTEGDLTEGAVDESCQEFAIESSDGCCGVGALGAREMTEGCGGVPLSVVNGFVEALMLNAAQTLLTNEFQSESVQAMSMNGMNGPAEER